MTVSVSMLALVVSLVASVRTCSSLLWNKLRHIRTVTLRDTTLQNHVEALCQHQSKKQLPLRLKHTFDPINKLVESGEIRSCADIGTDHGLLACALAPHVDKVFAVDSSESAINNCKLSVYLAGVSDKVNIVHGNGLRPLLDSQQPVDAVVVAGMSVLSTMSILSSTCIENFDQGIHTQGMEAVTSSFRNNMQLLQTKIIVVQPWPSDLVHMLYFSHFLLRSNWMIDHQNIVSTNSYSSQMTTIFRPWNGAENHFQDRTSSSLAIIFQSMPLINGFQHLSPEIQQVFINYLLKYYRSTKKKIFRCEKGGVMTPNEVEKLREMSNYPSYPHRFDYTFSCDEVDRIKLFLAVHDWLSKHHVI